MNRRIERKNSQKNNDWNSIEPVFDASIYSDDYVKPMGFTGMYVGIGCFDVSGGRHPADFDYITYSGFSSPRWGRNV